MALDDVAFARLFVDPAVPRAEIVRLVAGTTPAKLARVVALLRPAELTHGDDEAAGPAYAEQPGARHQPARRPAAARRRRGDGGRLRLPRDRDHRPGARRRPVQRGRGHRRRGDRARPACSCSARSRRRMELEMGIRGLVSYAETVSLYGTEAVFVDGDDTPYSKAILAAAYASRGVKMRVSSGAGAEVLMGGAERCSMLYLESRCVSLARAMGVQGVQNGGIDGASVAGVGAARRARADGRERHGDGAQPRGLHRQRRADVASPTYAGPPARCRSCSPAATTCAAASAASSATTTCSGPSQWNAEDIDDWLAMQRDWGVDGGLRTADARRGRAAAARGGRGRAATSTATSASPTSPTSTSTSPSTPSGRRTSVDPDPMVVLGAAQAIRSSGLGSLEVARALQECGYDDGGASGCSTCSRRGCTATTCRPRRSSTSRCRC